MRILFAVFLMFAASSVAFADGDDGQDAGGTAQAQAGRTQMTPAPFRTRVRDGQITVQARTNIQGSWACVCQGEGRCPVASYEPEDQSLTCQQTSGPNGCDSTCSLEISVGDTPINPAQAQTPSGH